MIQGFFSHFRGRVLDMYYHVPMRALDNESTYVCEDRFLSWENAS